MSIVGVCANHVPEPESARDQGEDDETDESATHKPRIRCSPGLVRAPRRAGVTGETDSTISIRRQRSSFRIPANGQEAAPRAGPRGQLWHVTEGRASSYRPV
jgi:hypothetical protein